MDSSVKKGLIFELQVLEHLKSFDGIVAVSNVDVYSFILKRLSPIDILVVKNNCIYVLELKSFNSIIQGDISDKYWEGSSLSNKTSIFNPVLQSREKLRSLKKKVYNKGYNLNELEFHSYVIVKNSCMIYSDSNYIFTLDTFIKNMLSVNTTSSDKSVSIKTLNILLLGG